VIVFCAVWLSACAGLPPSAGEKVLPQRDSLQSFFLEGRFSLRHEDKSYSGRLSWRHAGDDDELLLASPLGQGMAEIVSGAGGARLTTSDGKSYSAADAETLTLQVLGYPLPLKELAGWMRGVSRSEPGEFAAPDSFGRPLGLRQGQWRINYEYDSDDPQALPVRLFIKRDDALELRLRIDEWSDLRDSTGGESKP
jgi:outer membrane lipoprotein LolB